MRMYPEMKWLSCDLEVKSPSDGMRCWRHRLLVNGQRICSEGDKSKSGNVQGKETERAGVICGGMLARSKSLSGDVYVSIVSPRIRTTMGRTQGHVPQVTPGRRFSNIIKPISSILLPK